MSTYRSHWVDLDGPTHYVTFEPPAPGGPERAEGAPPLVTVHGLGGSHTNWLAVGPRLAEHFGVYAPDLAGHGRTRPDHRASDVDANQRLLHRFLTEVVQEPAVLMGNSMGGMISILQASRHPETVTALALLSPALPKPRGTRLDRQVALSFLGYATPGVGTAVVARRRRRLTAERQVADTLALCCVDPRRVPAEAVAHAEELARERQSYRGVERAFIHAARSVMRTVAGRERYERHMRAVQAPVLLLQGERDRLVRPAAARAAAALLPHWTLLTAPDLGHVPQLEDPEWTVSEFLDWHASVMAGA